MVDVDMKTIMARILESIYPVGSIFITMNSEEPSVKFGGTWQQIKGRFLIGTGFPDDNSNSAYGTNLTWNGVDRFNEPVGSTGGESLHKLTEDQIPSHSHLTGIQGNRAGDYNAGGSSAYVSFAQNSGVNTWPTGGGNWHNNMPPFLTVYMWMRIA